MTKKVTKPAAKKAAAGKGTDKADKKAPRLLTPEGRFSYPYLSAPDTGREYSDDKYKVDLLIDKEVWKNSEAAKKLKAAVLATAKKQPWGRDVESFDDFKHPFKTTDSIRNCPENMKNCILIRAKSTFAPMVVGPKKNEDGDWDELNEKQVKELKGGDWGKLLVAIVPYSQQGGGVSLCLDIVQFKQNGTPLGDGRSASLNLLDEMEVETDELETSNDEEFEEDEAPKKATKKKSSKKAQVEEEEEEESEDEDEGEDDYDFSDDEDEEEAPKRGKARMNGKASSKGFEF